MNRHWIKIIHVAKNQTGIDEDAYRGILSGVGVDSSTEIDTIQRFNMVMAAFKQLGFRYSHPAGSPSDLKRRSIVTGAPGYITKKQEFYIRGLQQLAMRAKDEKALNALIKRIGKVDDIRFLKLKSASAVILVLRDICWKAGIDPDRAYRKEAPCS